MLVHASASVPASIGAPDDEPAPEEDDDAPEELDEAMAPEDAPEDDEDTPEELDDDGAPDELDDETAPDEDPVLVVPGPGNTSLPPHAPTALAPIPRTTMR